MTWLCIGLAFAASPERVVSLGGTLTEIVYALGAEDRLVGVDASSLHPEAATALPQVGYHRQLGAEGLLSLAPDLVLATEAAGPPEVLAQVRAAGIPVAVLPEAPTPEAARARIEGVATLLDRADAGQRTVAAMDASLAEVEPLHRPVRVAFVFGRGAGPLLIAGSTTAAEAMIGLAGGTPAVTGFEGYRELTPEALVVAAPDVIVTTPRVAEAHGGRDALLALPAVAVTPAGRAGRLWTVDDLAFLGFGPRLGATAVALNARLAGVAE